MRAVDSAERQWSRLARFVHASRHGEGGDHGNSWTARTNPLGARADTSIRLRRVSMSYGSGATAVQPLRELDLQVAVGEVMVVSGPHRSGKTTLIELIGATQRPTAGEIMVCGRRIDLLDDRGRLEFRTANVALAPQVPTLAPTLTVSETIFQVARVHVPRADQWTRALLRGFDLAPDVLVANLSAENQQRLSLARALAKRAPLLLADEPLAAATAEVRQGLLEAMRRLAGGETTIVLTTREVDAGRIGNRVVRLGRRSEGRT